MTTPSGDGELIRRAVEHLRSGGGTDFVDADTRWSCLLLLSSWEHQVKLGTLEDSILYTAETLARRVLGELE